MAWTGDPYEKNLVGEFPNWAVFLHENQAYLGRTYIALARDGDLDPFVDTTKREKDEFTVIASGLSIVLSDLYQPDRINYANLRNFWPHCHWHAIPRYETPRELGGVTFTDANWGGNYAPYDKDFQIPEALFAEIRSGITDGLAGAVNL